MDTAIIAILAVLSGLLVGGIGGYVVSRLIAGSRYKSAVDEAARILEEAKEKERSLVLEAKEEGIWERIRKSIDDNVPVTAWNLFGDFESALMVGYDLEKDLAYGWGQRTGGKEYATANLSKWKSGGMYGYIIHRKREKVDSRREREIRSLRDVIRQAHRPAIEGG